MSNDWITDVLGDLKRFAQSNDMPLLAESLGEALVLARVEGAPAGGAPNHDAAIGRTAR
jgi:hypothetical protein